MSICTNCQRADDLCAGICRACTSPQALLEKLSQLPEPIRSVMLDAAKNFGVVDAD